MLNVCPMVTEVLHSECCGNSLNEEKFALEQIPMFQLSNVHCQQCAFITCSVQMHCILHVQFVTCLLRSGFATRKSSMCLPAFSSMCSRRGSKRQNKQPSCRDCSTSMEHVRTFALYVSHALAAPLRPGNADTASQMQSGPSSASGGGSILNLALCMSVGVQR